MNINQKIFKICFFGPSGSGKSTAAHIATNILLKQNFIVEKVNVAQPLHQIQQYIYSTFDLPNTGQDGPLLQFIAHHFESSLGPQFSKQIRVFESTCFAQSLVIINSDCRDNSYQYLKDLNFKFIRVLSSDENIHSRLLSRGDISLAQKNHSVEQTSQIIPDYIIDNNGSVVELEDKIQRLIWSLIRPTNRLCLQDLF